MYDGKNAYGLLSLIGNRKKKGRPYLKWVCVALFAVTLLFNVASLFFLPETMGVPISGMEHLNRMSSVLFLSAFTIMQGLLCYKGFTAQVIRCPIAGVLLLGLDAALVILNIIYPAGLVLLA